MCVDGEILRERLLDAEVAWLPSEYGAAGIVIRRCFGPLSIGFRVPRLV